MIVILISLPHLVVLVTSSNLCRDVVQHEDPVLERHRVHLARQDRPVRRDTHPE
jgi:hypothetical protein